MAVIMIIVVAVMHSSIVIIMMMIVVSILAQNGSSSIQARSMIIHMMIVQMRLSFPVDFLRMTLSLCFLCLF